MPPYTAWGNRVFCTYTYTKRKSDPEARLLVTYSEDQQQDRSGNELPEGQCVLDFELEFSNQGTGVDYETVKKSVVIDLTTFRSVVANRAKVVDVNGTQEGTLDIYFRSFNEKENPTAESQYELIFDTKSGFYFAYSEDELF